MKKPNNYKPRETEPPPSVDDLTFQRYQFAEPLNRGGVDSNFDITLSNDFIKRLSGDKTLAWQLGSRIAQAGDKLRG